jgi:hypothetical protein
VTQGVPTEFTTFLGVAVGNVAEVGFDSLTTVGISANGAGCGGSPPDCGSYTVAPNLMQLEFGSWPVVAQWDGTTYQYNQGAANLTWYRAHTANTSGGQSAGPCTSAVSASTGFFVKPDAGCAVTHWYGEEWTPFTSHPIGPGILYGYAIFARWRMLPGTHDTHAGIYSPQPTLTKLGAAYLPNSSGSPDTLHGAWWLTGPSVRVTCYGTGCTPDWRAAWGSPSIHGFGDGLTGTDWSGYQAQPGGQPNSNLAPGNNPGPISGQYKPGIIPPDVCTVQVSPPQVFIDVPGWLAFIWAELSFGFCSVVNAIKFVWNLLDDVIVPGQGAADAWRGLQAALTGKTPFVQIGSVVQSITSALSSGASAVISLPVWTVWGHNVAFSPYGSTLASLDPWRGLIFGLVAFGMVWGTFTAIRRRFGGPAASDGEDA